VSFWGLLVAAQPAGLHGARIFAGFAFLALLVVLAWALRRARRQLRHDEADAALEQEFRRLEQEASSQPSEPDRG
jgi:membrane protein implicated in regulation of membrane protease activity